MKKYISILLALFMLTMIVVAEIPANSNAIDNSQASKNSVVITEDWDLNIGRVDFIHYRDAQGRNEKGKPGGLGSDSNCYKLMGIKWPIPNFPISYIVNPINTQGLSEEFVTSAISTSIETWDDATSNELFVDSYTVSSSREYGVRDGRNVIAFGDYDDNNTIAVTTVWYTLTGKKIIEFDMLFNTRHTWGNATINSEVMDLQNIATHESGHTVGMGDIYTSACSGVTMYGYGNVGEIGKRTLELADIAGLQKMYGS